MECRMLRFLGEGGGLVSFSSIVRPFLSSFRLYFLFSLYFTMMTLSFFFDHLSPNQASTISVSSSSSS
jgi:hypothetical protein